MQPECKTGQRNVLSEMQVAGLSSSGDPVCSPVRDYWQEVRIIPVTAGLASPCPLPMSHLAPDADCWPPDPDPPGSPSPGPSPCRRCPPRRRPWLSQSDLATPGWRLQHYHEEDIRKIAPPRLTYDKCECRGHGDGQDNEEDGHGPPAAWAAAAEIFGEVCEALRGWQLAARLDWAQRVEIALKSSRQLLQLSWAPARCKVTSQKIISLSTFASLRTNLVLFWLILFKSSSMSPTSTQFGFS